MASATRKRKAGGDWQTAVRRFLEGFVSRAVRAAVVLVVAFFVVSFAATLTLRWLRPPTTAFIVQARIAAFRADRANFHIRRQWVYWDAISPQAGIAVVAAEDQRFPAHHGFDLNAIGDALRSRANEGRLRGASTISQQVCKNLFLWPGRSMLRKAAEAYLTLLLEVLVPKRRILEIYLNIAEFGDGVYGVEAASEAFFGKPSSALLADEAALLAAVLPNPKRLRADKPSIYVRERQRWIVEQMQQLGGPAYLSGL